MNDDFYKRRYRYDAILKNAGRTAVGISLLFLVILFGSIIFSAISAFVSYEVKFENSSLLNDMEKNDFFSISAESLTKDSWLPASAKLNIALYHNEMDSFTDKEQEAIKQLSIRKKFNYSLFTGQESRQPELAGMLTSIMGSIYTILVCLIAALPISVCAAIYLEEFAPKNIFTTLLEVNINNLAAVPSIVFGLIGLAVLINVFEFPRSAPITAGITLAMMIMPAMIITTRQAFSTIPSSIKHAALALGATKTKLLCIILCLLQSLEL